MRQEFRDLAAGWMLRGFYGLTEQIEALAEWAKANGPLQSDEEMTIKLMIESQIAKGDEL